MEEEKILDEGFERYLVVSITAGAMIVCASSFIDVLAELKESGIEEDDVIIINKIDLETNLEEDET